MFGGQLSRKGQEVHGDSVAQVEPGQPSSSFFLVNFEAYFYPDLDAAFKVVPRYTPPTPKYPQKVFLVPHSPEVFQGTENTPEIFVCTALA